MILNENNSYSGVKVNLDGQTFKDCKFDNCVLEFSATSPVSLVGCTFNDVRWVFEGPAALTIGFLKALYSGMGPPGQQLVEGVFKSIRSEPLHSE